MSCVDLQDKRTKQVETGQVKMTYVLYCFHVRQEWFFRPYWLPLWLFLFATIFSPVTAAMAQDFPYHFTHVQKLPGRTVSASLSYSVQTPQAEAKEWIIYANVPPNLPGQQERAAVLSAEGTAQTSLVTNEKSRAARQILGLRVPVRDGELKSGVKAQCSYSLVLFPRRLVPGRAASVDPSPTSAERSLYTSATGVMDFQSAAFQDWLTQQNLRRGISESDISLAWRAFNAIRKCYSYRYLSGQDRRLSALSPLRETDCGGLSLMFVGTLRANGIPARVLFGRWAHSGSIVAGLDNSVHVRSEFYAKGVGWIPVEMSGATSSKLADPMLFFGSYNADFVTLHVDTDLVFDSIWFGDKQIEYMQQPVFWATGTGTTSGCEVVSTWRVTH
jgi:transglutaminase-like putative cysteine protease